MLSLKNRGLLSALSLAFVASVVGCSSSAATEEADTSDSAIIGGVPVVSPKLNAVGSMQFQQAGTTDRAPFCTATLISPTIILTAKHCAVAQLASQSFDGQDHYFTEFGDVYFAIGNDAANPTKSVKVKSAQGADLAQGGVGFGSDVALYTLDPADAINDVTPLKVASDPLTASDIGKSFMAIGYGVQNGAGDTGNRTMGNVTMNLRSGAAYAAAYGDFAAFKTSIEDRIGRPLTPDEVIQVQAMYDQPLLDTYEAYFSAKDGDVQPCSGDSGGPLLRRDGNDIKVYGVASWVPEKAATSNLCSRGVIYATFGQSAKSLIDNAIGGTIAGPCGDVTVDGKCDGDTAVRCTTPDEGGVHLTRTRCNELGLVCKVLDPSSPKVGCGEP